MFQILLSETPEFLWPTLLPLPDERVAGFKELSKHCEEGEFQPPVNALPFCDESARLAFLVSREMVYFPTHSLPSSLLPFHLSSRKLLVNQSRFNCPAFC